MPVLTNAEAKEFGMNYYYNYSNTTGPPLDDVNIIWSFLLTSRSDLVVGGKICHHFSQKKGPKRWPFYPVLKANQCDQLSTSSRWQILDLSRVKLMKMAIRIDIGAKM